MPEVLTLTPLVGYTDAVESPCVVRMEGDHGEALRVQVGPVLHRFNVSVALKNSERATLDAFLAARTYEKTAFYWKPPATYTRTAVALGTGDGVATVFTIPTTGVEVRDYPINDATAVLKVNGVAVTATVSTSGRTFTATSPPALGTAVTADYTFMRLVRLEGGIEWTVENAAYDWNTASITLVEVVGD